MHSDYAHFFLHEKLSFVLHVHFLRTDSTTRDLTCYELRKSFHFFLR